jgi:SAM-dependent methyltransferase
MSTVIWHDLECGRYEQDLALWLKLAEDLVPSDQAVLDIGAGTGRVALHLARAGHKVVALDNDPQLLIELELRAAGFAVETICADARKVSLPGRSFPLIVVPMQTLQLFGGGEARHCFLKRAREHLSAEGHLAVAIAAADDFEEFEWHEGDTFPLPDIAELDGCAYFSQPTAVRREGDAYVLERRREAVDARGTRTISADRIALHIIDVQGVQEAGQRAGLLPISVLQVQPTGEHIGSQVVLFRG